MGGPLMIASMAIRNYLHANRQFRGKSHTTFFKAFRAVVGEAMYAQALCFDACVSTNRS